MEVYSCLQTKIYLHHMQYGVNFEIGLDFMFQVPEAV